MKNNIIICLTVISILASCAKKDDPLGNAGSVAFDLQAVINNTPFNIAAGKNNWELRTDLTLNTSNTPVFTSLFRNNTDNEAFKVQLNGITSGNQIPGPSIDSLFKVGFIEILQADSTNNNQMFNVRFVLDNNIQLTNYQCSWDFGDGTYSTTISPTHTYTQEGTYNVTMTAIMNPSCTYVYEKTIRLFKTSNQKACNADFGFSIVQGNTLAFAPVLNNVAVTDYHWNFGNGTFYNGATPPHQQFTSGEHLVTLVITDSLSGCMDSVSKWVATANVSACKASYHFLINRFNQPVDTLGLGKVLVEYTTPNGVVFSTVNGVQEPDAFFETTAIAPFEEKYNGKSVKKATYRALLYLYDAMGNRKKIEVINGRMGFVMPN